MFVSEYVCERVYTKTYDVTAGIPPARKADFVMFSKGTKQTLLRTSGACVLRGSRAVDHTSTRSNPLKFYEDKTCESQFKFILRVAVSVDKKKIGTGS